MPAALSTHCIVAAFINVPFDRGPSTARGVTVFCTNFSSRPFLKVTQFQVTLCVVLLIFSLFVFHHKEVAKRQTLHQNIEIYLLFSNTKKVWGHALAQMQGSRRDNKMGRPNKIQSGAPQM